MNGNTSTTKYLPQDSHSRVPVQDAPARIQQLEADLLRTQTELGSLRNQLQPWESITPTQAIDDFRQINKRIKELCRTISESILSQKFADVTDPTTFHMAKADLARFAKAIGGCDGIPSLVRSRNRQGRPLEDVLEYGLRSIINQDLCSLIFNPFHPSLAGSQYALVSGIWRANTFSTLDRDMTPRDIDILVFDFLDHLSADLKILKGPKHSGHGFVLSDVEHQELDVLFRLAYNWNMRVKSGAIFADFHPVGLKNDALFDPSIMVPYDGIEIPKGSPRILCAVTLGLKSSEASKGDEEPSYVWQEKMQVLTEEYFDDSDEEAVNGDDALVLEETDEREGKSLSLSLSSSSSSSVRSGESSSSGIGRMLWRKVKHLVYRAFEGYPEPDKSPKRGRNHS